MMVGGRLQGKVAIITGAGSGIGKGTALLFAREGAKVVVADINPDACRDTVQAIKKARGEATGVTVDVSRAADVEKMVRTAVNTYGKLDVLFNNAGIAGESGPLEKTTEEGWDRLMAVNLKGVYLGCKYAIPELRKNGSGSIINTSSTSGVRGSPRSPGYSASKGGVVLFTMSLAIALGKDNIRVNCILPGAVETGLTPQFMQLTGDPEQDRKKRLARTARVPLGRWSTLDDQAYAVLFLASDESSYITGITLPVDGGTITGSI